MPTRDDEPLPAGPNEIEEISSDFIIQDEATGPELPAPVHADDPFVAASRALVDESARTGEIAPRVSVARAAPREPARPLAEPPNVQAAPAPPSPPEPGERKSFPLVAALVFLLVGAAGGFFAGMLWERQGKGAPGVPSETSATSPPGTAPEAGLPETPKPTRAGAKPAAKRPRIARPAPTEAAGKPLEAKGHVSLTAPAAAEVYLDGKRIGRGSMKFDVKPGAHEIEVRLGKARVAERFDVAAHETWTYDVSPTK